MTGSVVSEVTAKLPRIRGSDDKIEYKYYSVTKLPPGRALLGSRFPPWLRGGEQETCYRLLTFQSRDPTSAWGQRNLWR